MQPKVLANPPTTWLRDFDPNAHSTIWNAHMREYKYLFMFNTIYNVLPTFGYTILDEGHGGRSSPHYGLWGSEISTLLLQINHVKIKYNK